MKFVCKCCLNNILEQHPALNIPIKCKVQREKNDSESIVDSTPTHSDGSSQTIENYLYLSLIEKLLLGCKKKKKQQSSIYYTKRILS